MNTNSHNIFSWFDAICLMKRVDAKYFCFHNFPCTTSPSFCLFIYFILNGLLVHLQDADMHTGVSGTTSWHASQCQQVSDTWHFTADCFRQFVYLFSPTHARTAQRVQTSPFSSDVSSCGGCAGYICILYMIYSWRRSLPASFNTAAPSDINNPGEGRIWTNL